MCVIVHHSQRFGKLESHGAMQDMRESSQALTSCCLGPRGTAPAYVSASVGAVACINMTFIELSTQCIPIAIAAVVSGATLRNN